MDVLERARLHAALADPHRLAIVDALALGDRTPQGLARFVGVPTNLLAHHLGVLEAVGLVTRRVSEGDGRRRYVVLRPDRLPEPVTPAGVPPGIPLFVCTHNSARSQFAAALWRRLTGKAAESAGADPATRVHPGAVRAAARLGTPLGEATPRGYDAVGQAPSLVVSVCDRAYEAGVPFRVPGFHWSVPDPVPDCRQPAFLAAFADISARVDRLAGALLS